MNHLDLSIQVITVMGKVPSPSEFFYRPDVMIESCQRFGYTPVILGQNPGEFRGLGSKAKLLKRALADGTVTASHILFVDAFDILFMASPLDCVMEFLSIQQVSPAIPSILWASEKACFPDEGRSERHPKISSAWRYLNSGFSIGESDGFRKFYSEFDPDLILDDHQDSLGNWVHDNDQRHAMDAFLDGSLSMELDYDCRIHQSLFQCSAEEFDFSETRIRNKATGTYPMVAHANGDAKSNGIFNLFLRHHGYSESRPR